MDKDPLVDERTSKQVPMYTWHLIPIGGFIFMFICCICCWCFFPKIYKYWTGISLNEVQTNMSPEISKTSESSSFDHASKQENISVSVPNAMDSADLELEEIPIDIQARTDEQDTEKVISLQRTE